MSDNKKRQLPRHVDGRVMIGLVPARDFIIKVLPVSVLIIVFVVTYFNPFTLFFGLIMIFLIFAINSELNNKETTLDIFKDMLRYKFEGDIYFERSCIHVPTCKRFIWNKIKTQK